MYNNEFNKLPRRMRCKCGCCATHWRIIAIICCLRSSSSPHSQYAFFKTAALNVVSKGLAITSTPMAIESSLQNVLRF